MLGYIDWNVDPVIFNIGAFGLRYYSLFFAIAFWLGYMIVEKMFQNEGVPEEWCDKIFIYTFIATIVGARLGHVFFYAWDYYSQHPIDIFKVWEGGLASHGGTIGLMIALYIYHKRVSKRTYLWVVDHLTLPVGLAAFFIRMGNLFNSEIYGKPTDVSWAFRFLRLSPDEALIPRHPTQIYEAGWYLITFFLVWFLYWKKNYITRQGALFGIFLVSVFGFRFIIEGLKENQEAFEDNMVLNMGQILSIPFVILGIVTIVYAFRNKPVIYPPMKSKK
ncbi:MAG: prolipoprotein diacylglyceryl transferase [Marinilabiliaceae bacterium]|nr:prolipoprotein diacylglyceryl transferase [Marinilabiliaceae bacterium]